MTKASVTSASRDSKCFSLKNAWFCESIGLAARPAFTAVYVARDAKALRRNVVTMPIYQVLIAFLFLAGFAATLTVNGLAGAQTDLALLRLVKQTFAPWFVGIVGGAGLLTALVPGSLIMLNASTTIARNIYREGFAPRATEQQVARVARTRCRCSHWSWATSR
ncbi:sodium:solute symporter family transporter [Paraburkholderia phytofirmans]|uniref:sodium:solute symporter family transporter n=1 Tax=Paraburkholderia phytofirmans TaxID=261302 RepID=UPI0038BA3DA1